MELPVKERLVGAAILVGLIVVLVPEMLSGPKDAETTDGTANSGAVRTYTIDLSAPGQTAQAPPPAAEAAPEPMPVPVEPQSAPPQPPPKPEPSLSEQPRQEAPKEVIKPAAEPAQKPIASVAATSGWAVQIGSFASMENAKKLVAELRAKGYETFVSSTGSGAKARHRVRVGPTVTRPQADKLAQRLKSEGRQVAVVSHP